MYEFAYISIQVITNKMILVDDGGGMDPECMRQCMSLGYSSKKSSTTIGQCKFHGSLSLSHSWHQCLDLKSIKGKLENNAPKWRQKTTPHNEPGS